MGLDGLQDRVGGGFLDFISWLMPVKSGTSTLGNANAANRESLQALISIPDAGSDVNGTMTCVQSRLDKASQGVNEFNRNAAGTLILAATVRGVESPTRPSNLGMGNNAFGSMIGWGKTGAQARARMGAITKADIQAWREQGLTATLAREWASFYRQINRGLKNTEYMLGNPAGRARLMRKIGSMMSNEKP